MTIGHDGVVGIDPTANPIYHAELHTPRRWLKPALPPPHLRRGVFTRCTPEKRCSSELPCILPAS